MRGSRFLTNIATVVSDESRQIATEGSQKTGVGVKVKDVIIRTDQLKEATRLRKGSDE